MKDFLAYPLVVILVTIASIPSIVSIYKEFAPASDWLVVDKVFVHDAGEGIPNPMDVDRTIVSDFTGEWVAEIHAMDPNRGAFSHHCSSKGENEYHTTDQLPPTGVGPKDLNINWWTWPKKCKLTKGKYRIDTIWRIKPLNYPQKEVRHSSNVFEVTE